MVLNRNLKQIAKCCVEHGGAQPCVWLQSPAIDGHGHLHLSKDTENANIGTGDWGLGAMKGNLIFSLYPLQS